MRALGTVVLARRLALHLTETQLAQRLGVDEQVLKQIERGQYDATVIELHAIARALGVTLAELFRRAERRAERADELPKKPPTKRAKKRPSAALPRRRGE